MGISCPATCPPWVHGPDGTDRPEKHLFWLFNNINNEFGHFDWMDFGPVWFVNVKLKFQFSVCLRESVSRNFKQVERIEHSLVFSAKGSWVTRLQRRQWKDSSEWCHLLACLCAELISSVRCVVIRPPSKRVVSGRSEVCHSCGCTTLFVLTKADCFIRNHQSEGAQLGSLSGDSWFLFHFLVWAILGTGCTSKSSIYRYFEILCVGYNLIAALLYACTLIIELYLSLCAWFLYKT